MTQRDHIDQLIQDGDDYNEWLDCLDVDDFPEIDDDDDFDCVAYLDKNHLDWRPIDDE